MAKGRKIAPCVYSCFSLWGPGNLFRICKFSVVQWGFAQQGDQKQSEHACPGDQMKAVDERKAVGLQPKTCANDPYCPSRRGRNARGLSPKTRGQLSYRRIVNPVSPLHVQAEKIRM